MEGSGSHAITNDKIIKSQTNKKNVAAIEKVKC